MTVQVDTLASVRGIDYSPQNRNLVLGDGSLLLAIQHTAAATCSLYQSTNPGAVTPSFAALSQTFTLTSSTDLVVSLWRAPGSSAGTDDVWVCFGSDASAGTTVQLAHAIYTYSGNSWNWDNTGTTVLTPSNAFTQTVSVVWNGNALIVVYRDGTTPWQVGLSYTTTRNGSTGWVAAIKLSSQTGTTGSHFNPLLLHDSTLAGGSGATICIYPNDTSVSHADQLTCRVLLDSAASPALANWQAEVQDATTGQNTGAAQLAATVDPATATVHVVSGTSIATAGIYYNKLTVNASGTASWTGRVLVDNSSGGVYTLSCGVDVLSRLYVFFQSGTIGSAGVIKYYTADSPYSSFNGPTTTAANTTGDCLPQIPKHDYAFSGYIPLLWQRGTSSFSAQYDNTIAAQTLAVLNAPFGVSSHVRFGAGNPRPRFRILRPAGPSGL